MMPVRDDISHRKKWLNLHWNYLWGNVWGLTLLQIFKNLCSIKDLKKSFYTLHMSSTGFKMEKKKKAPVCHWYSAYVFHKVSCDARGNTVTVNPLHTSNTGSSFQNQILGFLKEKRALSQIAIGESPLTCLSTSHQMATSGGCKHKLFQGIAACLPCPAFKPPYETSSGSAPPR